VARRAEGMRSDSRYGLEAILGGVLARPFGGFPLRAIHAAAPHAAKCGFSKPGLP